MAVAAAFFISADDGVVTAMIANKRKWVKNTTNCGTQTVTPLNIVFYNSAPSVTDY